jgi:hypothetical protein
MSMSGAEVKIHAALPVDGWDPLAPTDDDADVFAAAQKREIRNILKSYTGYYDLFSEMIQNALDAVEKRSAESEPSYAPSILIQINIHDNFVCITDNGCSMSLAQLKKFLKPSISFKDGPETRGNKGVGATYLAFGFNHLEVAAKPDGSTVYAGILKSGRTWLEDTKGIVTKPNVESVDNWSDTLAKLDRGTSIRLKLVGDNIRPKSLQYFIAKNAEQWSCLLRAHTPLGGVYLCGDAPPKVNIEIEVTTDKEEVTKIQLTSPGYLYPHEVLGKTADLREFLKDQVARVAKQQDVSKVPPKFSNVNGIWGEWSGAEILAGNSPIKPVLDDSQKELMASLKPQIYAFMCYSTDLWDDYNDNTLKLRKGSRILHGGLQQATTHMPQGNPITIPLTNNTGFQQITHIIVHFHAEPDLGRKGFQPEHTAVAERLSTATVAAFRRYFDRLLRKNTGAPALLQQMKLSQWIDEQREHEKIFPLVISGKGLFAPQFELPIRSVPIVEQDVVALFNQMLSSGIVRGIQLLSSSQFNQYDGLYRFRMEPPFDLFIRSAENPLGVDSEMFAGEDTTMESPVGVLEYKFNLDALIEEIDNGTKNSDEIKLAICWTLGTKWQAHFTVLSYLDHDNLHHRQFHGITHHFSHAVSGLAAFSIIVLEDLVKYLTAPEQESIRQKQLYAAEEE